MLKTKNIILAGVGGQGIISAANILSAALLESGFDVKKSDTHGMAQRGGAVVSFVRFGKKIFSPVVSRGEADFILAFEKLEAGRNLPFASKNSTLIINDLKIPPLPVATGTEKYPENIEKELQKFIRKIILIPAHQLAREAGSSRTANLVMLGVLRRFLPVRPAVWEKVIREYFNDPEKVKMNLVAFESGVRFKN